jgi:hypothetical protein
VGENHWRTYRKFDKHGLVTEFHCGAPIIALMRFEMEVVMAMGRDDWQYGREKMHCFGKQIYVHAGNALI